MSDYLMVTACRRTKDPIRTPRFTPTKNFNSIAYEDMMADIESDIRLAESLRLNDSRQIAQNIIN